MIIERIKDKLENYKKAVLKLEQILKAPEENDYKLDAIIKRFEFTYELSWKLLKAYLEFKGIEARTPRDCFKEAFAAGIIEDGNGWIDMLDDRNITSHTYDEDDARMICERIEKEHFVRLAKLLATIEGEILR